MEAWFDEQDGKEFFHFRKASIAGHPAVPFEFDGPATDKHREDYALQYAKFLEEKKANEEGSAEHPIVEPPPEVEQPIVEPPPEIEHPIVTPPEHIEHPIVDPYPEHPIVTPPEVDPLPGHLPAADEPLFDDRK